MKLRAAYVWGELWRGAVAVGKQGRHRSHRASTIITHAHPHRSGVVELDEPISTEEASPALSDATCPSCPGEEAFPRLVRFSSSRRERSIISSNRPEPRSLYQSRTLESFSSSPRRQSSLDSECSNQER